MDACTVEVGLLRKHACGHPSVAKCGNCEQPLCSKHALPQLSASGAKTGTFLCAQCNAADQLYKETAPVAVPAQKPANAPKPAGAAPAAKAAPAAPPAAKPAPAEKNPEPSIDHSGALEFTSEPKKPADPKK